LHVIIVSKNKDFLRLGAFMYLRKMFDKRRGCIYLSIVHGYRDSSGKVKSKVVKSLGSLDDLKKEYEDPISHFTNVAKAMESERQQSKAATIKSGNNNLGYASPNSTRKCIA